MVIGLFGEIFFVNVRNLFSVVDIFFFQIFCSKYIICEFAIHSLFNLIVHACFSVEDGKCEGLCTVFL